ncbi:MAG: T9SS type A sorting domain-containing protein [Elusimicrobiota bacterium]
MFKSHPPTPHRQSFVLYGRLCAVALALVLSRPASALNLAWDLPVDTSNIVGYNIFWATHSMLAQTTQQVLADPTVTQDSVLGALTTHYSLASLGVGSRFYFRAASYDGSGTMSLFDEETVDVSTRVTLTAVVLTPATKAIAPGAMQQYLAVALDQNRAPKSGVDFVYSTAYSTVAAIDVLGLALAMAPGATLISASTNTFAGLLTSNWAVLTVSTVSAGSSGPANDVRISNNPIRPSRGITSTTFDNLPPNARLRIFTLSGGLIRDISADSAGVATWNATGSAGEAVPSGVYFVLAQGEATRRTFKIVVQR